jgi:virulence factor Mce-like protein
VLTLVVIAAAVYIAFGGRLPWQHDHLIHAVVRDASELQNRSPVRIAGVDVGHVTKVERGPGHTAIVTMNVTKSALPIHRDATLKIRPRLFLEGNFFVEIQPGTPGSGDLPENGTIPLAQTANPVQLDQVLTSLQSSTRQNLRSLVTALSQSLDHGGAQSLHRLVPNMSPALIDTAVTAQALHGQQRGDLAGFIADGERTARALSGHDAQLADLITGLDRTLTTLAQRRGAVAGSVSGLNDVVGTAPGTFAALNSLFPTARAFVREARPGIRAAPATLRLANPLLVQVNGLVGPPELPALLDQLDPSLRSLAKLEPQLGTLLARVRPVTECLRRNGIPTLKKSVVDPPLTTGQPVYRELLDATVGLASASQDFTGDGPSVRYHAGFGDQTVTTGKAPSLGEPLVGLTSEPLLGSRPRYTGVRPPYRPDVPCTSQAPPDLAAQTGPAPQQGAAK